MSAQKEEQINLLPQKGFQTTTTGRVLAWILSTFRVIVIVTEIIVMIAFLSRFWLDAQNSDLDDDLERKQSLLTASLSFENEFRDTQKRLKIFSQLVSKQENLASTLEKITRYLPQDLFLKTVNFSDNSFQIDGISLNETNIQQYIVNLQSTGSFSDIGIREIKSDPKDPNILKFSFIAQLK